MKATLEMMKIEGNSRGSSTPQPATLGVDVTITPTAITMKGLDKAHVVYIGD